MEDRSIENTDVTEATNDENAQKCECNGRSE